MRDNRLLVRFGRSVEPVELILTEEAVVARRRGIVDVDEEGIERRTVPQLEPDDHLMPLGRRYSSEVGHVPEERGDGTRLHEGRSGAGRRGKRQCEYRGEDSVLCPSGPGVGSGAATHQLP